MNFDLELLAKQIASDCLFGVTLTAGILTTRGKIIHSLLRKVAKYGYRESHNRLMLLPKGSSLIKKREK